MRKRTLTDIRSETRFERLWLSVQEKEPGSVRTAEVIRSEKNTQLFERLRLSAQTKKLTIQPLDFCCNLFTKTIQPYKWLRVSAFRRAGIIHSE